MRLVSWLPLDGNCKAVQNTRHPLCTFSVFNFRISNDLKEASNFCRYSFYCSYSTYLLQSFNHLLTLAASRFLYAEREDEGWPVSRSLFLFFSVGSQSAVHEKMLGTASSFRVFFTFSPKEFASILLGMKEPSLKWELHSLLDFEGWKSDLVFLTFAVQILA